MKKILISILLLVAVALFLRHNILSHTEECVALEGVTKEQLAQYGVCSSDAECTIVGLSCPFDCRTPVAQTNVDETFAAVSVYQKSCMMVCPDCPKGDNARATCREGRCVVE
jgi:hypothetical protein